MRSISISMMTISIPPDAGKEAERVAALPRLPRDAGGPVFAEPWQAQAFALAVKLSEEGHFTGTNGPRPSAMSCALHLIAASPMTGHIIITIGSRLWSGLSRPKACLVVRRYKRGRKRGPKPTDTRPMASRSS
jgi:hypothetical protein